MIRTELRSYQREAFDAAREHDGFAFFPEQRTGKCLISLALVDYHKPDAVVIVCPKKALKTWEDEVEEHLDLDWECEIFLVTYQEPVKNLKLRQHYYKWSKKFVAEGNTLMVIIDEAHMIKKPATAQSRFARTLGKRAHWRLALTGTPIDKGYEQFWCVMDFIQHDIAFGRTYENFKTRYCIYEERRGKVKKWIELVGYQHTDEIMEIVNQYSYRITFNEARVAMGKKPVRIRRKKVYFNLDEKSRSIYDELETELEVFIDGLLIESPLPVTNVQKLQQICGGFLLHQTRLPGKRKKTRIVVRVGDEKLTKLMQLLSGMDDRKVVICCRFSHEIEAIEEMFDEFGWTYKEISGRSEWDDKFDVDYVILQVKSGLGFDLSQSNTYIFYSWDHSYITFEQSRFRIMNMETTDWVNYFFLMARDTIEDEYYEAPNRKKDFTTLVLDKYRKKKKRGRAIRKGARRIRKARKVA